MQRGGKTKGKEIVFGDVVYANGEVKFRIDKVRVALFATYIPQRNTAIHTVFNVKL